MYTAETICQLTFPFTLFFFTIEIKKILNSIISCCPRCLYTNPSRHLNHWWVKWATLMPLDTHTHHPSKHTAQPLMAAAAPAGEHFTVTCHKSCSGMARAVWQRVQGVDLASEYPRFQSTWEIYGSTSNLQDSKSKSQGHWGALVPRESVLRHAPLIQTL